MVFTQSGQYSSPVLVPHRKTNASAQEAVRKDVERTFSVLQQRFRIIALPCKLWNVALSQPSHFVKMQGAYIILHTMIVEDEIHLNSLAICLKTTGWTDAATGSPVTLIANALCSIEDEELYLELKMI